MDEINDICQSDNNSYPIASKTRRVNAALDRFFTLAFQASGLWSLDDYNQTDLPSATCDLSIGQQDYALDIDFITIKGVFAKDSQGTFRELTKSDAEGIHLNTASGTPLEYDLVGNSILLDPIPDYASDEGLKIVFERNKSAFTVSDTTKIPGIPSIFHQYLCRLAALPYLIEFQKAQKNDVGAQIILDEEAIRNHFATREKSVKKTMKANTSDTK